MGNGGTTIDMTVGQGDADIAANQNDEVVIGMLGCKIDVLCQDYLFIM